MLHLKSTSQEVRSRQTLRSAGLPRLSRMVAAVEHSAGTSLYGLKDMVVEHNSDACQYIHSDMGVVRSLDAFRCIRMGMVVEHSVGTFLYSLKDTAEGHSWGIHQYTQTDMELTLEEG